MTQNEHIGTSNGDIIDLQVAGYSKIKTSKKMAV